MVVGIVGSEASKFTEIGEARARGIIDAILIRGDVPVSEVVSGACHLGGIDIWAAELGRSLGIKVTEFPPKEQSWSNGYKPRNIRIAKASDVVYCLTVDKLPPNYTGMRFDRCYHCNSKDHVKSGGCWTMLHARKLGKEGLLVVIPND